MILILLFSAFIQASELFTAQTLVRDFMRPGKILMQTFMSQMPIMRDERSITLLTPNFLTNGNMYRNEIFYIEDFAKIFLSANGAQGINIIVASDNQAFMADASKLLELNIELPEVYTSFSVEIPNANVRADCSRTETKELCIFKISTDSRHLHYLHTITEEEDTKMLFFTCAQCKGYPIKSITELKTGNVRYYIDESQREVSGQDYIKMSAQYLPWLQEGAKATWNKILN